MSAPVVSSVTFDKPSYNVGDKITATVKYSDSNTHGVTAGSGMFTPVANTFASFTTATPSVNPKTVGDIIVMHVITQGSAPPVSVSGGNCTWKKVGTALTGTVNAGFSAAVFVGTATAVGAAVATITFTGSPSAIRGITEEFHSSTGQYLFVTQGNLDSTGSNTMPVLNPTAPNQLYSVFAFNSGTSVLGQTAGYTYQADANGNGYAYDANCTQTPQSPQFGDSGNTFGIAILLAAPLAAGTFTAIGGIIQSQTSSISINPQQVGDLIVMFVESEGSAPPLSITGGNCTWQQVGVTYNGVTNTGIVEAVFVGTAVATGAATATVTFNGTPTSINNRGQEFYSSTGTFSFIAQAPLDSAGTNQLPSLSPTGPGQLYAVSVLDASTFVAGATPGYVYELDVNNNGLVFNPNCTSDPQAPTAGDSTCAFGVAVLLSTGASTGGTPPPTPAASPLIVAIATHAGTDQFGNPFQQGVNAEKGSLAGTTLTVGNTLVADNNGLSVYNGAPVPANLQLTISPQGIVTKAPLVFNQSGGTPIANANGGATGFSGHGDLQIVDGIDQQAYSGERRSIATGGPQPVTSTNFGTILKSPIGAGAQSREYRIHGELFVSPNQTGGKVGLRWTGPGATTGKVNFLYKAGAATPNNTGGLGNGVSSGGAVSITMVSGTEMDITIDGTIQVPANTSGTFTIDAAEGTAGDSFSVLGFSYIDVMPV